MQAETVWGDEDAIAPMVVGKRIVYGLTSQVECGLKRSNRRGSILRGIFRAPYQCQILRTRMS